MAAPLRIQSDWAQALRKDEGEAWLSCHPPGKPTLYGSLTCQGIGLDGIPEVTASEGFIVNEINKKSIHISCPKENSSSKFLAPYTTFSRIHAKSITCLDISSGGGLGVSSSADGTMKIWQASNGELRRVLEGHVFDVNCCRFFPSGLVVLSGGMDAQLKIWSAEDASCVVTFKGHKGGILDTAIVDRGRNVVSGSRDGTVRLWDCGRSACLGVIADCGSSINGVAVGILDTAIVDRGRNVVSGSRDGTVRLWDCGRSACLGVIADCGSSINGVAVGAADNSINLGSPEQMPSEREVGTESKMLLLAREDKKLQCLGLQSRQPASGFSKTFELWGNLGCSDFWKTILETFLLVYCVFLFIGSDAFNCCTFLSGFLLLAGTQDGNIYQLDVRSPRVPVQVIHRSGARVLSVLNFRDGFIASQGDGSCFIVQQDLDYVIELTGTDCDPVYKVATWEKQIYTCCRDGLVRRYQLSDL
ncbi:Proteasomal ATPase-associated factor 1 [Pteropus alecto]|uniref:Proteasomal ATPase-associated factor 1 n=1 Tax=Pteropus alecto TaxID=9402 RepID=L5JQF7_PTEAL|nr:Proteasomal ATPase-associated factor 1 [Pteropus alecto]